MKIEVRPVPVPLITDFYKLVFDDVLPGLAGEGINPLQADRVAVNTIFAFRVPPSR